MSVAPPTAPPPAISTRPSGRSSAVEWYWRPFWSESTVVHVSVSGFQISAGSTDLERSSPSERELPPLASTVPSGSSVMLWYARPCDIGAVSRQAGVGALMSITAVRPFVSYASGPPKSGSAHVPDFMILFGRYITELCPSNGLVVTVDHVHGPGVNTRVVVSGPTSRMRPSERTNSCG